VDEMYHASVEALIAAAQIGVVRDLLPPDRLREEILALLQRMVARSRQAGISDPEIAEARYALVAFIDERILKSAWQGRDQWMSNPLQLQLYAEWTAGENFFARMRALLQRGDVSRALEIYYLCLALGFTGALATSGATQNAQSYFEAARARLPQANLAAPISPHAISNDHHTSTAPRPPLVLALALGCAFVLILGLGLFSWSLGRTLEGAERELTSVGGAPTRAAGAAR
jgi:type IV/VI secretion system ImpK/VasF family protein